MGFYLPAPAGIDDYPKAKRCPNGCGDNAAEKRRRACGLVGNQNALAFAGYKWSSVVAPAVKAIKTAVEQNPPSGFILISGPYGCGKTHILAATINQALARNFGAIYSNGEGILSQFKVTFGDETKEDYWQVFNRFAGIPVLCVDEFDRINSTGWAESEIFKLLNSRYESAVYGGDDNRSRLTVLATNAPPSALPPYLLSRLSDGRAASIFEITGAPDMRQLLKKDGGK